MYKVLIADDERLERMAVRQIIENNFSGKCDILEAENGRKALEICNNPDIAILDIKMPGISGLEVARKIKNDYPSCKIIMLTGFTYFTYAKECISIGVVEFLVKPFLEEDIIKTVQQTIQLLEAERQGKETIPDVIENTNTWISVVREYIEENYTKDIYMEEIAKKVGFSPYYFSRMFKQEFTMNFVDYITKLRLEKACMLLSEGNCTVKEVCFKVGYSEPNYFTRVFKKAYGVVPTKYQQDAILAKL